MPHVPRRAPLLHWEPLPFIVTIVLLMATGAIRPTSPPWLFWPYTLVLVASIVWLVVSVIRSGRPMNPTAWGALSTLDGLAVVQVPSEREEVRSFASVARTHRQQGAIDLALVQGGRAQHAVLVPRARLWMGRRYRIGVQLTGGGRPRTAGILEPAADTRWAPLLEAFRLRGAFVAVPALIVGEGRPFTVELDVSGLAHVERSHDIETGSEH